MPLAALATDLKCFNNTFVVIENEISHKGAGLELRSDASTAKLIFQHISSSSQL
jgi:hypothetical protein